MNTFFVLLPFLASLALAADKPVVATSVDSTPDTKVTTAAEFLKKVFKEVPTEKIFASQCEKEELWSSQIGETCFSFGKDMGKRMHELFLDANEVNCKVPTTKTQGYVESIMSKKLGFYPLLATKMPKEECGFCGRKIQCCKSDTFLTQSYRSTACPSKPCNLEPLNTTEIEYLRTKYSTWNVTDEPCQYGALLHFFFDQITILKTTPLNKLYCQLMGAPQPTFNCIMNSNTKKCMCCCAGRTFDFTTNSCKLITEVSKSSWWTCPDWKQE